MLILILIFACIGYEDGFDRESFENSWWEISLKELCFDAHGPDNRIDYNQLLIYEDQGLSSLGEWIFQEPNVYMVNDKEIVVEKRGNCWSITESIFQDIACKCTLNSDLLLDSGN